MITTTQSLDLTVVVPQGIGDVFWVHRRLLPHARSVHYRIPLTGGRPEAVERRAGSVVRSWPGVAGVEYLPPGIGFEPRHYPLAPLLAAGEPFTYVLNYPLEHGIPLEATDPDLAVAWDFPLPRAPHPYPAGRYLLVYVSGDAGRRHAMTEFVWSPSAWVTFVTSVLHDAGVGTGLPVVVLGATYDRAVTDEVAGGLGRRGFEVVREVDPDPPRLYGVLADCWAFLGYQSGLSVLADHLGVHQAMVYFPRLRAMQASWVRPEHRAGRFNWRLFSEDTVEAARHLHLPPPPG